MSKTTENTPRNEAPDDIIVLGVATVDTLGPFPVGIESMGTRALPGIAEE
ncbi:hypothetical protein LDO26_00690 [Luteimonas sp. BDR2-5]|nr:hypothetical protein [Luteimonas sp. BDR2-5]MCD9026731.1 hypothetical protein [Luteimonas sp. BDR2-5]